MHHDLATPLGSGPLKPLFLLGDELIDRDHEGLLAEIEAIIDSDNVAFPTAVRVLLVHIEQHFEREQELMAHYGYRGLRDHKAEHSLVLRELQRCLERVDHGLLHVGRAFITERLVPWFELHVSSADLLFVLHIQKQLEAQRDR